MNSNEGLSQINETNPEIEQTNDDYEHQFNIQMLIDRENDVLNLIKELMTNNQNPTFIHQNFIIKDLMLDKPISEINNLY